MAATGEKLQMAPFNNTVANYTKDLKNSLLLKDDMPNMLAGAPMALALLGRCKLLALSGAAAQVTMEGPFRYLKYQSLPGNLVQLVNQGQRAFEKAQGNMESIQVQADALFGSNGLAQHIVECLSDERMATKMLDPAIVALRDDLQQCSEEAKEIEVEFNMWSEMAMELSELATVENSNNDDRAVDKGADLVKVQAELEAERFSIASNAETLQSIQEDYEKAKDRYLDAADKQSLWRDVGPIIVTNLFGGMQSLVNGAVGIVQKAPDMVMAAAGAIGQFDPGLAARQERAVQNQAPDIQHSKKFPDAGDEAYLKAGQLCDYTYILKGILIDDLDKKLQENNIRGMMDCRAQLGVCVSGLTGRSRPSMAAISIANICQSVIDDIKTQIKTSKKLDPSDQEFKTKLDRWVDRVDKACEKAATLKAEADAQPGEAFGSEVPMLAAQSINVGGPNDLATAANRRQAHLVTMQSTMLAMQSNHQKATAKKLESQLKAQHLTTQLARLQSERATFDDIRKVLIGAMECIGELQNNIRELSRYFARMAKAVDFSRKEGRNFIMTIESGCDYSSNDKGLVGLTYSQVQAQSIFGQLLMLRGHFGVIKDEAKFYIEVSEQFIMPALDQVNMLPLSASEAQQRLAADKLTSHATESANAIAVIATKRQTDLHKSLQTRIEELSNEIAQLPPLHATKSLPARQLQAIKEGANDVENTAAEVIDATSTHPIPQTFIHGEESVGKIGMQFGDDW